MQIIYVGEEMPDQITKSLFLAGPTSRNPEEQESWRPDAIKILENNGFDGTIFVPEPRDGKFKSSYDDQVGWEEKYLNIADCIVFWVPRDLEPDSKGYPKMLGLTTNVEFGVWGDSGKIVFGAPPKATKNSYLKHYATKYNVPVAETLTETLDDAMEMLGEGAPRTEGERYVPLYIWNTPSFQSWYLNQKTAGNRLDHAQLLYTFRPGYKKFVFMWVLKVNVYVEAEKRNKDNEFVLSRTDISSVLLWKKNDPIENSEVILVKEFRSPANTEDCFIRELPGGSSFKKEEDPQEVAAHEVFEETGFHLSADRLTAHTPRQLAGTLSAHKAYFYSAEIDEEELKWFKSQDGIVHGNIKDSERTFIEVFSIKDLCKSNLLDWTTIGQILSVIYKMIIS